MYKFGNVCKAEQFWGICSVLFNYLKNRKTNEKRFTGHTMCVRDKKMPRGTPPTNEKVQFYYTNNKLVTAHSSKDGGLDNVNTTVSHITIK
jgi:hypothetical protein